MFLGCVILTICSVSGWLFADKYVKRRKFYQDFYSFNKAVISDVSFGRVSVKKIVQTNYEKDESSDFYASIRQYFEKDDFFLDRKYLSEEEKQFVKDYSCSVGMKDGVTELNFLTSSEKTIGEKLNSAKEEEKKYKKLYLKLGFLIGLVFFIALL